MHLVLEKIGIVTNEIATFIWPIFLPLLLVACVFISYNTFKYLLKQEKGGQKLTFKDVIGPASISLGAKIGTGSIIGVLGSLNKLSSEGQGFVEGIALWGLIGALILLPLTYSETFVARLTKTMPSVSIKENVSKGSAAFYAYALMVLYIFGFGGFQFNGIDTVTTIAYGSLFDVELSEIQRYLFIVLPVIAVSAGIVLTKKHNLFINSLSGMIGLAVVAYLIFFLVFFVETMHHIPVFLTRAWYGFTSPVAMGIGAPIGLIFGLQRIIQTSEAGLGTSPLASEESKEVGSSNAAMTQMLPTAFTVAISLFVTTYITSYGLDNNIIVLPADGIQRLTSFLSTAQAVTGVFGIGVISVFALLSGVTTLLGSYYYLTQLLKNNSDNRNIVIYVALIFIAGTLAVFGFDIIFDIVDILLFAVCGLNVLGLGILVHKQVGQYKRETKKSFAAE